MAVSRVATGSARAGLDLEVTAIAALILGKPASTAGRERRRRSVVGVMLLALTKGGFNIFNANPFHPALTTGVINAPAALGTGTKRR